VLPIINPPPLLKLKRERGGGGYFHQQWQGYVLAPIYFYLSEQAQQWQQKVNNESGDGVVVTAEI